jgi:flagellar export protein FliJ
VPDFKFRAQVALDLRRKRDEAAQRELAEANAAVAAAEAALAAAVAAFEAACRDAQVVQQRGGSVTDLIWHRNWIASRQREIERRTAELDTRRREAEAARLHATRTHMDVRVLEKFKDRAWRAYTIDVRRAEQKDIDWLAVLRASSRDRQTRETS